MEKKKKEPIQLIPFRAEGENFQKLHLCEYLNELTNSTEEALEIKSIEKHANE
jgi:hypothetical protein